MTLHTIDQLELTNKVVWMRVDFNVPINESGQISDDTRIRAALPTIQYALKNGARLILASHLGRPKGDGFDPTFSLAPVATHLAELLNQDVIFPEDCIGDAIKKLRNELEPGDLILLENLRFHKEETQNDSQFSEKLAEDVDIYINDAFGTAHRAHASTVGVPSLVSQKGSGFLVQKELESLTNIISTPERPFLAILGGAKVSDKLPVIDNLLNVADSIAIGGGMAYTFLKAQGFDIGNSLVDESKLFSVTKVLERAKTKGIDIYLPLDHVVANECSSNATPTTTTDQSIPDNLMGLDVGPKTIEPLAGAIQKSKTVFWNGPLGVFEIPAFAEGSLSIAKALASSDATSVVGGGDSVSAINQAGVADQITHISTGGGASLEFIEGKTLPGIDILKTEGDL